MSVETQCFFFLVAGVGVRRVLRGDVLSRGQSRNIVLWHKVSICCCFVSLFFIFYFFVVKITIVVVNFCRCCTVHVRRRTGNVLFEAVISPRALSLSIWQYYSIYFVSFHCWSGMLTIAKVAVVVKEY